MPADQDLQAVLKPSYFLVQSHLTKYTRRGHWPAGYLVQLDHSLLSMPSAGACCCRSETVNGHFRSTPGICHCWPCLQVGPHTQRSASACTGHFSAALQNTALKIPVVVLSPWSMCPHGSQRAVHLLRCSASLSAAATRLPVKRIVSQPVRPVPRGWSSLQAVRQQPPIQAVILHSPGSIGLQAVRQQLHPDIRLVGHPRLCSPAAGNHSFWQGRNCCRCCQQEEEERCVLIP